MVLAAGTNWFAFAAALGVSFFLTPYLIGSLGKPRYDIWCVVESILNYFTLLDMGIAACLVREIARKKATRDVDSTNRITSACLAIYTAAGAFAMLVGVPLAFAFVPILEAREGVGDVVGFAVLMLANLASTLPLSVFPSILDGLEKFAAKSAIRVLFLAIRTASIVIAIRAEYGLLALGVIFTVTNLLEHLAMAALCRVYLPGLRLRIDCIDRVTLKAISGYSTDAFLAMLAGRITVQTGAIAVGFFLPVGQVTYFATAARLVEYAKTLLRTITATLTPGVSAMEARGDWAGIRRILLGATRGVMYIVLPINLGLWFFGKPFLARWVGADFIVGSYPALAILSATLTIGIAQSVASRLLYGLGKLKIFARFALAEAGLFLLFLVTLIGPYGVEGVAIATAISNAIFCVAVLVTACRAVDVGVREYAESWLKPMLITLIPLAIWALWGPVEPTWPAIATAIAAGVVPYALCVVAIEWKFRPTSNKSSSEFGVRDCTPSQKR